MTNQRVAGLVWKISDGVPLILTHLPAKSSSLEDYSVTTVTGTPKRKENGFSAMARTMRDYLGIERAAITDEQVMSASMESLGKKYTWYLLQVDANAKIVHDTTEIQDYNWNPPAQLPFTIDMMRAGRRFMFEKALAEACKRNLLSRAHFSFLPEPALELA